MPHIYTRLSIFPRHLIQEKTFRYIFDDYDAQDLEDHI